jgi:hypothetical protein
VLDRPLYDAWLRRLRSGEWKQGRNNLCSIRPDGTRTYCCLGVLAEIMVEADLMHRYDHEEDVVYEMDGMHNDDPQVYLPTDLIHYQVQSNLAAMNDQGASFYRIADEIEQKFELAITNPEVYYEDPDQRLGGNDA